MMYEDSVTPAQATIISHQTHNVSQPVTGRSSYSSFGTKANTNSGPIGQKSNALTTEPKSPLPEAVEAFM